MESGAIKNQQITAYSQYDENHGPENARLNQAADGRKKGAWSAETNDLNQWLQVDMERDVKITKFVTQGRQDYKQWVKSYTLSFSTEKERVFQTYQENGQDKVKKQYIHTDYGRRTCKIQAEFFQNAQPVKQLL